jgi:hypothetical protein
MQAVRAVIARTAFSILRGLVQSAMARGPLSVLCAQAPKAAVRHPDEGSVNSHSQRLPVVGAAPRLRLIFMRGGGGQT